MSRYYSLVLGKLQEFLVENDEFLVDQFSETFLDSFWGTEDEVRERYDEAQLTELNRMLRDLVRVDENEIDMDQLIYVLEGTRGAVGFDCFTEYRCKRCGRVCDHSMGNVPEMCGDCAYDLAYDVVTCPYDVVVDGEVVRERLAEAMQGTVGKLGLCVMTNYVCGDCGKTAMSGSHLIPRMCYTCALGLADRVMSSGVKIVK